MDLKILYTTLPDGMDQAALKRGLEQVLEEDGWLTGSGPGLGGPGAERRAAKPQIRHSCG